MVTPHAAFLALRWAPDAALANLERLRHDFGGLYGKWGFRDSVNVDSGVVSSSYLSLDQGMIMAAIGGALEGDLLRDVLPASALRPVIGVEEFGAQPRGCTITGTPRADRLLGTSGPDVICAGEGNDRAWGDDGDDTLYGGDGDDRLTGGDGENVLSP